MANSVYAAWVGDDWQFIAETASDLKDYEGEALDGLGQCDHCGRSEFHLKQGSPSFFVTCDAEDCDFESIVRLKDEDEVVFPF